MRQALLVKNPKWEPYTKVSEAAKSEKEPWVLVVRGRAKERHAGKAPIKFIKNEPVNAEELAANLRKEGKDAEAIEKAVKAFKPKTEPKSTK